MDIRRTLQRSLPAVALAAVLAWTGPARAEDAKKTYEVDVTTDVKYYDGQDADPIKHKLDLYLPKGKKDFPVLFFVHGGAWMMGDKNTFGVYSALARGFAKQGIGTVVTNYRLTPTVMHPGHIQDVAKAFAWTEKNIAKYGGRADCIFACGHSAGGHLVALLATDESYLKAEGLTPKAIKGVVPMSGVYDISPKLVPAVFGNDPKVCKQASPISHVKAGLPPFLVIYADNDMPNFDKMAETFCKALKDKDCTATACEVKRRNHVSLILLTAGDTDPAGEAIRKFIAENGK